MRLELQWDKYPFVRIDLAYSTWDVQQYYVRDANTAFHMSFWVKGYPLTTLTGQGAPKMRRNFSLRKINKQQRESRKDQSETYFSIV